jgi:hypothetical protein
VGLLVAKRAIGVVRDAFATVDLLGCGACATGAAEAVVSTAVPVVAAACFVSSEAVADEESAAVFPSSNSLQIKTENVRG